jgi:hypothetical protein
MSARRFQLASVAAVLAMTVSPLAQQARAASDDQSMPDLLNLVKQIASQGQNADTTAKLDQSVDQNQDLISTVLRAYIKYFKALQDAANKPGDPLETLKTELPGGPGGDPRAASPRTADSNARTPDDAQPANASQPAQNSLAAAQPSNSSQPQAAQLSSQQLQPSRPVRPSDGLQTSHLAGYPSLPDIEPSSSVTKLTAAQVEYVAQIRKDNEERKQSLIEQAQQMKY